MGGNKKGGGNSGTKGGSSSGAKGKAGGKKETEDKGSKEKKGGTSVKVNFALITAYKAARLNSKLLFIPMNICKEEEIITKISLHYLIP